MIKENKERHISADQLESLMTRISCVIGKSVGEKKYDNIVKALKSVQTLERTINIFNETELERFKKQIGNAYEAGLQEGEFNFKLNEEGNK